MPRAKKPQPETGVEGPTTPPTPVSTQDLTSLMAMMVKTLEAISTSKTNDNKELASALGKAIELAKPKEKITAANRKAKSPWDPKDGSPKLKLKRKMYQHGVVIDPDFITNDTISALNKLKTGRYFGDWVKVYKRKDQGIDIDYPIKTAAHRTKLATMGISEQRDPYTGELLKEGLQVFVEKMLEEAKRPKRDPISEPDED